MVGTTEPTTSCVGTIRGDLTLDSYQIAAVDDRAVRNLIHCSDSVDNANNEIALWFDEAQKSKHRHQIAGQLVHQLQTKRDLHQLSQTQPHQKS